MRKRRIGFEKTNTTEAIEKYEIFHIPALWDIPALCQRLSIDLLEGCLRYPDISDILLIFFFYMPQICVRYARDIN